MDPEQFRQQALAEGYTPAEIDAYLAQKQAATTANPFSKTGSDNLGRAALQGVTFGFADEIAGMLPEWMGGGEKTKQEMRDKQAAFKSEHPWISGGMELAGGLAVPGLGAIKTLGTGAKTIRGAIGSGAALGGASGALYGAGTAEGGVGARAKAAVLPGILGAAAGGVIPGVAATLKSISPAVRATTRLNTAAARSGGLTKLQKTLDEFKAAGRGNEVMMSDLSDPLRQATDFAVNASDDAAEMVGKKAYGRQADASGRILDDVRGVIGDPNAEEIIETTAKGTAKWAGGPKGFEGLRQGNPAIVPQNAQGFIDFLKSPALAKAWGQARSVGLIGPKPKAGPLSFEVLQDTKEMLDDAVDAAFKSGRGGLGTRLGAARDELKTQLETNIPDYGRVSAEYAHRKGLERLVKEGQEAFSQLDPRGLAKRVSTLKADELEKFREGIGSELIAKVRSTSTNRDLAKTLVDASPALKDKLRVVFGSQQAAESFMEKMRIERELAKVLATLGGSQTAKRLAAQQGIDALELATDVAAMPFAPWSAASRLTGVFRSGAKTRIGGGTAKQLAPKLSTQGASAIEALLNEMKKKPNLLGSGSSRLMPVGFGVGAGLLTDDR